MITVDHYITTTQKKAHNLYSTLLGKIISGLDSG